jgi:hypothetical protein
VAAHASLVVLGGLTAMRTSALAAEPPAGAVGLVWQAPAEADCASGAEIRDRVTRLTERPIALEREPQSFQIEVAVSEQDSSWRAVATLRDPLGKPLGSREVRARSPSCRTLDVSLALVIATMADGLPKPKPQPEKSKDLEDESAAGGRVGFGAFAAGSAGLGPSAWFGMGLELEVEWSVPVALEASAYLPRDYTDELGRGAQLWAFHAGARACPRLYTGGAVSLRMCGAVQVGAEHAQGIGLTKSESAVLPLALMGIGPSLLVGSPHGLSVQVAISAAWVFVRPRFDWLIEGEPHSLQGSQFAALARIGVIGFVP